MKILIEGIGGIGGVIAHKILQEKYDCTLITSNEEITNSINKNGVVLIEKGDQNSQHCSSVYTSLDELDSNDKFDIILLIMKATSVVKAAKQSLEYLSANGFIVTMQNGIVEDDVSKEIGKDRTIGAIIGWGGTMLSPGVYERTTPGDIHIGELDGKMSDRVKQLSNILTGDWGVIASTNIYGALWSKLAINCCITTLGALTGQTLGELLNNKETRNLFLQVYAEVVETAEKHKIKLERIAANPYLLYLPANSGWLKRTIKDVLVKIVAKKYKNSKSSSLQSLQRGRKTEIDYLNGYVVKQAHKVSIPVPVNTELVKMIKEIESGKRQIDEKNIPELIKRLNS